MKINRDEIIWAAGLFDGEGHVRVATGQKHNHIRVQILQKDRFVLDRFQKAVLGLGKVYGPYSKETSPVNPIRQSYFQYVTGKFESCQAIIAMLWPFVSPIKRDQFKLALTRIGENHLI